MGKHQRTKPMKPFLCGSCKGRFFSLAGTTEHIKVQHPKKPMVEIFERVSSVVNERIADEDMSVADMMVRLVDDRNAGAILDETETMYADMAEGRI